MESSAKAGAAGIFTGPIGPRARFFHLLRGRHQQPDILPDEFLANRDRYQVIFLTQKRIAKAVADRLGALKFKTTNNAVTFERPVGRTDIVALRP